MTSTPITRRARRAMAQGKAASVLTPAFRRWGYGVTIAAVAVAIFAGWLPPGATAVLVPLAAALFFVNDNGEPR